MKNQSSLQTVKVKDFSLSRTVESGQIFRVSLIDGFYYLVVGDKVLKLKQEGNMLYYECSKKISGSFVRKLFGLDEPYRQIIKSISKDRFISSAVKKSYGLRIIRQEPWECMLSYICSANASVKKVKNSVNRLSAAFGRKIEFDGFNFYSFPERLGSLENVRKCGVGFRSANLVAAANSKTDFMRLKKIGYAAAKRELMQMKGIGSKIADCILLYSLDYLEAFPVDRWIKRAVEKHYSGGEELSGNKASEFGQKYFGRYAGYAQLFIYDIVRRAAYAKGMRS